jgi:hypothetical protein
MYRFTIFKQDHSQPAALHFLDRAPDPKSTILLPLHSLRLIDNSLNPINLYKNTVWPLSHREEIWCEFHPLHPRQAFKINATIF